MSVEWKEFVHCISHGRRSCGVQGTEKHSFDGEDGGNGQAPIE